MVPILCFYLERRRKHLEIETNDPNDMIVDTETNNTSVRALQSIQQFNV